MKNDNNSFTAIEAIVVIAIVCIVALIATPSFKQYYINSQIENLKADIEALESAGMMYYFDHGEYPINYENLEDFAIDSIPNEDNIISKLIMNVYASSPETQEAVKVASINEENIKDYIGKLNYNIESYVMTTKGTVLHGEGIPDINGHLIHHYLESENVDLEDIINKEPILNQGGKLINNDRPKPPNVEIIEDVNIIVDGGPGTEVKLGVNGGWYDSPHTFSDLAGEYAVYSRYKETDTHYAGKISYATTVNIALDKGEGNGENDEDQVSKEVTLNDIAIGSIVYDPNWEWEHKPGDSYSGSGVTKPVKWIVVAKNHYAPNQIILMTEEIIARQVLIILLIEVQTKD